MKTKELTDLKDVFLENLHKIMLARARLTILQINEKLNEQEKKELENIDRILRRALQIYPTQSPDN